MTGTNPAQESADIINGNYSETLSTSPSPSGEGWDEGIK